MILIYVNSRTDSPLAPEAFCHQTAVFRTLWLAHILQSNSTTTGRGEERENCIVTESRREWEGKGEEEEREGYREGER